MTKKLLCFMFGHEYEKFRRCRRFFYGNDQIGTMEHWTETICKRCGKEI